jgi:hypothetical protein
MLKLLLACLLTAPAAAAVPIAPLVTVEDEKKAIDPAEVKETVGRLEAAFKSDSTADRIAAIEAAVRVPDKEVAKTVAGGLKDKDAAVFMATVDALGHMQHPEALAELEKYYKQNKKRLQKDAPRFSAVIKACARHGQNSSIAILSDDLFSVKTYEAVQARIYGLGNIRTVEAIEALTSISRKTSRNNLDRYMAEFRLALFNITGVDQGNSPDLWGIWWRDNKKTFKIPEEVPEFPPEMRGKWKRYWGLEGDKKRRKNG